MNKVLNVKCPHCGTEFSYYKSKFRPFCSERCKMVDLGHWLEESYRIPEKPQAPTAGQNAEFEEEGFSYEESELEGYEDEENSSQKDNHTEDDESDYN